MDLPTVVTARRALGITKMYIVVAIFFSFMAIAVWGNVMYVNSGSGTASNSTAVGSLVSNAVSQNVGLAGKQSSAGSGIPLLALPLDMIPLLMMATPVVLLFVYDKNNGVLEYLLSLGMTQRDIYTRYLKATVMLAFIVSIIFVPAVLAFTYATQGAGTVAAILPIPLLVLPFALAVSAFMVTAMMAFSSLQKTRAGSNQPLGLAIGWAVTGPAYLVALLLPFRIGIYADLALVVIIALVTLAFLQSSGKLIRREKLLP